MNKEIMEQMIINGEKIKTSYKDSNNNDVCLGDKLVTPSGVIYEVRIRNDKFVLHTGGYISVGMSDKISTYTIDNSKKLHYSNNNELIA